MKYSKIIAAQVIFLTALLGRVSPLQAENIGVVSESEFSRLWKSTEAETRFIGLDGARAPSHGCVSFGFLVEKDGTLGCPFG